MRAEAGAAFTVAPERVASRAGMALVFTSAVVWSFGGAIARFIEAPDPWTIVFWRSAWAAAFLLGFLFLRDGFAGGLRLIGAMRLPALGVAACFATASTSFVVALGHTTVANILFFQAGVPLMAALIGRVTLGERIAPATALAIAAVGAGILVMVSDSLSGGASLLGGALSLLIALCFALATIITRAHAGIRMVPAVWIGTLVAGAISAPLAGGFAALADMALLVLFGAFNLGLGLALFVSGVRLIPAAIAALIGTAEPVLGPVWVWLTRGEVPAARTLTGGAIVIAALLAHLFWQIRATRRS
ncbi:MAG TPA: DMT family transporter [Paracoccaceae bacterium]|nr:DMT family transporter [Paracoccaceae bacterium]